MKTTHFFARHLVTLVGACSATLALTLVGPICAQEPKPATPERIGVYDSRAIAVAYAGSSAQVNQMKDMREQMKKAREQGNTNKISQLEREGQLWQSKLNRQGFGTAPVDDLLEHIADHLPAIQEAAGVTTIISKWNKAELNRHPDAVRIDVTMQLVKAFQPSATQWKHATAIQKTKPQKIND